MLSHLEAMLMLFYRRNGINDDESEKRMIIKTATKLIFNDIKSDNYKKKFIQAHQKLCCLILI